MNQLLKLLTIISIPFIVGLSMPEKETSFHTDSGTSLNPEYLDGKFTGGFGEETCRSCHFDYDLNMEGGSLNLEGVSESYEAGEAYEITVTIQAEQLEIGGFQLTSRFEDGTQAGNFSWEGDHLMFTPSISDNVMYLQHSANSTKPNSERSIQWTFTWTAPEHAGRDIILNVAANSGNYDDSSFGDWIYAKELTLRPQ